MLVSRIDQGWPLRRAADRFGVLVTTARRWADRYRQFGKAGMAVRSSVPKHSPGRTSTRSERRVLGLRATRRWGHKVLGRQAGKRNSRAGVGYWYSHNAIDDRTLLEEWAYTQPYTSEAERAATFTGRIRNERQQGWSTPFQRLISQWAQLDQQVGTGLGFDQWMTLVWKVIRPHLRAYSQLEDVVVQRYAEAVYGLGVVPQLLSVPTHHGNCLDGSEFARRLDDYQAAGAAARPLDLSVALGRVNPADIPAQVSESSVPVTGCANSVGEVVRAWLVSGPAAPRLEFLEPGSLHPGRRMVLHGATVPEAELLGLDVPPWTNALPGTGRLTSARALELLPVVPGRAAAVIMHQLAVADDGPAISSLESVGGVARPFGEILTFAALAVAHQAGPAGRDRVAAVLLNAWHEERLTADDLLAAWRSPWRTHWPELNPARIAACLLPVAESGGLALVWPLLCALADELAAAAKLPVGTAGLLEALVALAPEVVAARHAGFDVAGSMPAVATLAASKGSSKAAQAALQLASAGVLGLGVTSKRD